VTRAPVALALAALVSAPRIGAAEPCAPRAELGGDAVAVDRVTGELGRLGVTVAPAAPGCPAVKAVVELDRDGGIAVAVQGAAQRSEGRVVSDAALAAVWIDSWLRDDLDGWTASPARVAVIDAPVPPSSVPSVAPPSDLSPAPPAPSVFERFAISAAYEQAWTDDGSSWSGGNVSACVRVGALCLGGRARAAFEPELAANVTAAARSDLSVLATASLPIDVGQFFLAPEVGLGLGRFTTRRLDGCAPDQMTPPNCDPMDPMCVPPPVMCESTTAPGNGLAYVGDGLDASSYTPRLAIALRVAVPLFRHVWLDGLASFTLAPFGHRDDYAVSSAGTDPSAFPIPGEPGSGVQLGVGLRVGAP